MSFKKNGYAIIKQAVNEETANVLYNYFLVKKLNYKLLSYLCPILSPIL